MPNKTREIRKVLSLPDDTLTLESAQKFFELEAGTPINVDQPVFPRIEKKKSKADKKATVMEKDEDDLLDISEFARAQLIVAEVIEAARVDGTDKLLKLQIDLGKEKRQIVAGIAEHYTPEEITGKRIVVVANLKPAKIRGVESNGMLLAAKKGKKLVVVTPDGDLPPGAKVS
jgi:methionyl-tRNA synthetase